MRGDSYSTPLIIISKFPYCLLSQSLYNARRRLLRLTWLQPHLLEAQLGHRVKIIFVLGLGESQTQQDYIRYENEMYGDVVQSDFIDSYRNNTYKVMSFLR